MLKIWWRSVHGREKIVCVFTYPHHICFPSVDLPPSFFRLTISLPHFHYASWRPCSSWLMAWSKPPFSSLSTFYLPPLAKTLPGRATNSESHKASYNIVLLWHHTLFCKVDVNLYYSMMRPCLGVIWTVFLCIESQSTVYQTCFSVLTS